MSIDDRGEADPLEEILLTESSLGFLALLRTVVLAGFRPAAAWVWSWRIEGDDDMVKPRY